MSFYGTAAQMGDLARVAATFRIINIDADPGANNFSDAQLQALRANGKNRVISYLNVGSCEKFRSYWSSVPSGFESCGANRAAQLEPYHGYPDETWMNPGNAAYRKLVVAYVAPRLAARGIDGFFLDNLEVVEHTSTEGRCDPACQRGGLDLVRELRERFPEMLIVMQNATGDTTRLGTTGGVPFPTLLDGVTHEEVYAPTFDDTAEQQLSLWRDMAMRSKLGHPFFIGVEDYVGSCKNKRDAASAYARSRAHGFSPYASDESAGQKVVCFWDF